MNVCFLEVQGLKKSFGFKPVLRGINLSLAQGERMALLGANGTGKTTLLRILAGLTRPSGGSIHIDGLDMAHDAQLIRSRIGFVAHQSYLYDELTALENLLFFARMYAVDDGRDRAFTLLQRVGLEHRARERVSTFSRGQLQRLSLARALLHAPRLLLLDEPDTGLDQSGLQIIDSVLAEHTSAGGATLFTTHQLERAYLLSDHIGILRKGRILNQRATATLDIEQVREQYSEVVQ